MFLSAGGVIIFIITIVIFANVIVFIVVPVALHVVRWSGGGRERYEERSDVTTRYG